MKRYLAILGAAMFFVACVSLYLMMESVSLPGSRNLDADSRDVAAIEAKIKQIENDLQRNHKTIKLIKDTVKDLANGDTKNIDQLQKVLGDLNVQDSPLDQPKSPSGSYSIKGANITRDALHVPAEMCSFANEVPQKTDVQMLDVFDILPFDNPGGGVWTQGFPISYSVDQWRTEPLKIFVVPHSHTDPGWIKTFDRYYAEQTRHILDNMVDKLETYPKMRFIYAEMSFFSLWWHEIDSRKKDRVKKLIAENRFEIVTGGWVMADEANAHYFAMLDQMIEGNQWLLNQVGVKPRSGWAIDPFGHSPTMAYLLKRMGFHSMLIQRVHYSVKKYLAQNKQLEFMWRQNWDLGGQTDMFCHMMPFYSYDVPHTCGPDPKICCQFDFKRLPGGRIACPWKVPPTPIGDTNVEDRAKILLDQYRKKSQLYQSNVVLIPLGDDFRYDKANEWDQQYQNYQKLFDYMNSRNDWHVQAQFGTLSDYFSEIYSRTETVPGKSPPQYPVLSGDFFTYSDREDNYWSGYYTSRPFYKRLDRELEAHLRGAEILFSLAVFHSRSLGVKGFPEGQLMKHLVGARRSLGLFQHHDGITGTAKDFVVVDYGQKMLDAMMNTKRVIVDSAHFLMLQDKSKFVYSDSRHFFDLDEARTSHDSLPDKTLVQLSDEPSIVVFYNSLGHSRKTVVRVHVTSPDVEVRDPEGHVIPSQTDPFWMGESSISPTTFKVAFLATIPAMGLSAFKIRKVQSNENRLHYLAKVELYNAPSSLSVRSVQFSIEKGFESTFTIDNADVAAQFSTSTGTLQKLTLKETKETIKTEVKFMTYGVGNRKEHSGAYLFLPDGPARPLEYNSPVIRVIRGPIVSEVHSFIPFVEHVVRLENSPGVDCLSLDMLNIVDIHTQNNKELCMRIETGVLNKNKELFTDLNGFQIQRRKSYDKLPLQANFYPMPMLAYIEDAIYRFSVLSGQALGVASLEQGWLEVMQDRRLNQDDNRGLGQGVLDNKRTPNRFRFLLERRLPGTKLPSSQPSGFPSLVGHLTSQELIHPVTVLPRTNGATPADIVPFFESLANELSCDLHVVNLRSMQHGEEIPDLEFIPKNEVALILNRLGIDCNFATKGVSCPLDNGQVTLDGLFSGLKVSSAKSSSLSLIHDEEAIVTSSARTVPPMEIEAFKIFLK